jgi:hypothetical protein
MKTKLLAAVLLAGSSLFAAPGVVVGVGVGGYGPPPPVVAYAPPPRPGYRTGHLASGLGHSHSSATMFSGPLAPLSQSEVTYSTGVP